MAGTFTLRCNHSGKPSWADSAFSVFENQHGEQWIAAMRDDDLVIAGGDYDWVDLVVTKDEIMSAARELAAGNSRNLERRSPSLMSIVFDPAEAHWIKSVVAVAIQRTAARAMASQGAEAPT